MANRIGFWIGGTAAAALAGLAVWVYATGPSDEEMIDAALEEAVQASREGRPFGVLEHMAGNFQFNGQAAGDRSDIIRYVRTLKPDVKIQDRRLTLDGDSATWTTPVKIVFGDSESGVGGTFEIPDVKIHFRRSFGTRMTFFPYSSWKMERVDAPNFLPPMLPF